MTIEQMAATAQALVAQGKGILAADESTPTMAKRLAGVGLESTEERRRAYRELLFTSPGLAESISGVILYDETIRQRARDGTPLVEVLRAQGVIPGIKVDGGTTPLAGRPGELVTQGLDGLRPRLEEYAALGARFAKWRAVLRIDSGAPSPACIEANAHALARYAALAQEAGLAPIVEPEVLMDGDHGIEICAEVTETVLHAVYDQLHRQGVQLEATLLKPNMVLPGSDHAVPGADGDERVAEHTLRVMRRAVPAAVPGLVFLLGGQSDEQATARLDALNRRAPQPWELSFSFGRTLQSQVLRTWAKDEADLAAAQEALRWRAALNSAARYGSYHPGMEARDD